MTERHVTLKGKIEELGQLKRDGKDLWWVTGAIVREGFGTLTDMTVEFVTGAQVELRQLVGQPMAVELEDKRSQKRRSFGGICVSLECLGQVVSEDGLRYHHVAKVRHWLWMLTRTTNNRIFQDMSTVEIIEKVFSDHGFSGFQKQLRESYEPREYCVQYHETDFDFLSRLMQEEGIYYFFDNALGAGAANDLVLCDDASGSHKVNPAQAALIFTGSGGREAEAGDKITDWSRSENVISGKVTLNDFDMLVPTSDLKVLEKTGVKTSHSHAEYELYGYPGKFRKDSARGQRHARVRMQAEEVAFQTRRGATNARSLSTGYLFELKEADKESGKYLVTEAVHYIRPTDSLRIDPGRLDRDREDLKYPKELEKKTDYVCYFGAIPEKQQFRSKSTVPWPAIAGLHTAIVTGKDGEEIWTDEYGRIKVRFHWDREGGQDENSSCWVRVATPWSGKEWGMIAVPRIGQEVVIQFEEGDPDRPICTGMLWNNDTKPPYALPEHATQLGLRSNSSKGGGGYNELMFEDKKGAELMRVQAQKDHQCLIKNKSVVTIGQNEVDAGDHDEEGSLSEVIRNHVTRTIQEGNHYHTIKQGDEELKIETGSQKIEIETDKTQTIQKNYTTTVAQGDQRTEVDMGDQDTEVKMGNITVRANMGKIEMEAMQSIELKVGASSIKIEPAKITVNSVMVEVQGNAKTEIKSGGLTQVTSGGITMISGGPLVKIN